MYYWSWHFVLFLKLEYNDIMNNMILIQIENFFKLFYKNREDNFMFFEIC